MIFEFFREALFLSFFEYFLTGGPPLPLPFSVYLGIKMWILAMNPTFVPLSACTVSSECSASVENHRELLQWNHTFGGETFQVCFMQILFEPAWLWESRYVRYTRRWRKKCPFLHRIQWRIWWCAEFGDKFSTDFFTEFSDHSSSAEKAYVSVTILSLNSVIIYWWLFHHWIRWWFIGDYFITEFGSPGLSMWLQWI